MFDLLSIDDSEKADAPDVSKDTNGPDTLDIAHIILHQIIADVL